MYRIPHLCHLDSPDIRHTIVLLSNICLLFDVLSLRLKEPKNSRKNLSSGPENPGHGIFVGIWQNSEYILASWTTSVEVIRGAVDMIGSLLSLRVIVYFLPGTSKIFSLYH